MSEQLNSPVENLLQQHAAFWRRDPNAPPLLAPQKLARYSRLGAFYHPDLPREGAFTPAMIHVDEIANRMQRWLERDGIVDDPLFQVAEISHTIPWLEAMLGCSIYFSFDQDTMWAETPDDQPFPPPHPDLSRNAWMLKLEELTQAFSELCGARLPVGTLQLRGATDLLGAYVNPGQLGLVAYDDPASLHAAVQVCAALGIEVSARQLKRAHPFHGGYVNYFQVWAPGTTMVWSQDLATIFSPAMYREFFLPFDTRIAASVAYPLLHIHTSELHCLPLWAEIPGLTIEVTMDPTGVTLEQVLPTLRQLQNKMPLMLQVQNDAEYERALADLSPVGLHLISRYPSGRPPAQKDQRFCI